MRIVHLGYEDPRQPGSGGGAIRTREINSRLAARHDITVVVAGYPGARPRVEEGVRWLPIGPRTGGKIDRLAYFALLGAVVTRARYDLLVEDFSAPFSVGGAPIFTRRPVVASVQWLFARQMRAKYGLPFDWVERSGLRLYDNFIAVSDWLAQSIRRTRPRAAVVTIPNGVPAEAFDTPPASARHLLFLGRLDLGQKGGDLLIDAYAGVRRQLGSETPPLLVAGDGPDRQAMQRLAADRKLTDWIQFVGRVEGPTKYGLLAAAYAVLMPSRFETFGMVAVEAQAAGAPVVAFDVGPLAEVAGGGGACLAPAFDVEAFAQHVVDLLRDPAEAARRGTMGRAWARRYDWDLIATRQEAWYERRADSRHAPP